MFQGAVAVVVLKSCEIFASGVGGDVDKTGEHIHVVFEGWVCHKFSVDFYKFYLVSILLCHVFD